MMPAPNRSGGRRGGSYSRQRASNQRQNTQRRTPPARGGRSQGGYGNGRSSGGNDQLPIFIALGGGAVVLVGVLAFLLLSSGDETVPVVENPQPEVDTAQPATKMVDGDAPEVLAPFSSAEKDRIRGIIEKLDADYDRAKDLKDEGFVAQNKQDYDAAQEAWQEAHRILSEMDRASNDLEIQFGESIWERIERFLPTQDRTLKRWGRLKSDVTKQLNMLR